VYLYYAVRFWSRVSDHSARQLMRASFAYLPAILMLLLSNPMPV
jgi:protoheme IX farnesyltransferase